MVDRVECAFCNHQVVCKPVLRGILLGECPFYEPEVKKGKK